MGSNHSSDIIRKMDVAEVNTTPIVDCPVPSTKVNIALKNRIPSENKIEGKKEKMIWGFLNPFLRLIGVKKPYY